MHLLERSLYHCERGEIRLVNSSKHGKGKGELTKGMGKVCFLNEYVRVFASHVDERKKRHCI